MARIAIIGSSVPASGLDAAGIHDSVVGGAQGSEVAVNFCDIYAAEGNPDYIAIALVSDDDVDKLGAILRRIDNAQISVVSLHRLSDVAEEAVDEARRKRRDAQNKVDEAGRESFPASDAPAFTGSKASK